MLEEHIPIKLTIVGDEKVGKYYLAIKFIAHYLGTLKVTFPLNMCSLSLTIVSPL